MAGILQTGHTRKLGLLANQLVEFPEKGASFFMLLESAAAVACCVNNSGHWFDITAGYKFSNFTIDRIEFRSLTNQTIKYSVGFGGCAIEDTSALVNLGDIAIDPATAAANAPATGDVTLGLTSVDAVKAQNLDRRSITVIAHPANTGIIRVAESGVGAAAGLPIQAGGGVTLETTSAIYACNETSLASQKVCVLELI